MRKFHLLAAVALLIGPFASAPATPTLSGQDDEQAALAGFRAAIDELRAALLQPGERVAGWDEGGADPDAELRALGAQTHFFLVRGETGVGVSILTDRPIADFASRSWQIADSYGVAGEQLETPQVDFMPISDRYIMAMRGRSWRQNDVGCFRNLSHALLYEVPGAPSRADDETVPMMFRMMILAMEDQTVCVRNDGNREQGWRSRFFLPDGRLLPALTSADDLTTIVRAAPVETLIVAAPERETSD